MTKRVVIYGINYAPEIAGVGRYTGEIGEHLTSLGHEVRVITAPPHYPGWKAAFPGAAGRWRRERVAGADVYRCPIWLHPEMKGIRRLLAPLSFAISSAPVAFWQILKRRPDVVIVVEPTLFVAPVALLAAKLSGALAVLHVQDLEVDAAFAVGHLRPGGSVQSVAQAFERLTLAGFDRVITISRRMADQLALKGVSATRIAVVRNWVDLDLIGRMPISQAFRRELGLPEAAFVVLYSGALGAKQGIGVLLDAARQLAGNRNIIFAIAGEGPMKAEVQRAADTLLNVRALDFQPQARFAEFLGLADLHVLPQDRAAADLVLPSKLGGMLASGRPILVASDTDTELGDFLGSSCAFAPPGDAQALARAIERISTERPCQRQAAERLALARLLSKHAGVEDFATTALFMHKETSSVAGPPPGTPQMEGQC